MADYGTNANVRGHENESYAAVLDIPIMASPLYQMPQPVSLGNRLAIIPENLNKLLLYPFTLEEEVLEGIKEFKVLESARYEELERKYQQYVEDKIHRQKVAARKIAPGFLDTDTKILTPKPLNTIPNGRDLDNLSLQSSDFSHNLSRHNRSLSAEIPLDRLTVSESTSVKPSTSVSSGIGNKKPSNINYLEFEQGLAPLDPWDTPESDLDALHEIWQGGNSTKADYRRRTMTDTTGGVARGYTPYQAPPSGPPSGHGHPQVRVYQPQQSLPLPQKQVPYSSSPHYPIGRPASGTSSPVPHKYPPTAASPAPPPPARPPKAFEKTSPGPPPPPPPAPAAHTENIQGNDSNNGLIKELVDMGFSREQAQVALEKNDNDISKATNFLLDSSE